MSNPDEFRSNGTVKKSFIKGKLFKKSLKKNGLEVLKFAAEVTEKVVPQLDIAIQVANTIINIYEQAKYNEEVCKMMANRVELALASIKLLKRNMDNNDEKFQKKSYYMSVMRFVTTLNTIKLFTEEISGIKGFRKHFVANYVKDRFETIREQFDEDYKALQLAISIDQVIDREEENRAIFKSINDLKVYYQDIRKDIKERDDQMMETLSVIHEKIENLEKEKDDSIISNIKPPQIDPTNILPHDFSNEYRGDNITLMKYKGNDVACKEIKYSIDGNTSESKKIRATLAIWSQLDECPNIIRFYGISHLDVGKCMIFEWAELGNLKNVYENTKLPWRTKLYIARDVFRGLCFLHFIGILHHDVKAKNILVTSGYKCKISNFELSRKVDDQSREVKDIAEIIRWTAPEKLEAYRDENKHNKNFVRYTNACEMFSFGMFLWELSFNKIPYKDIEKPDEIIEHVIKGNRETLEFEEGPSDIIEGFAEIITLAWKQDPRKRPKDLAVSRILGRNYPSEIGGPMIIHEQSTSGSATSLKISRTSSNDDEDLYLNFSDDDDDNIFELLPLDEGIKIHNKESKTDEDKKRCYECFDGHAKLGNTRAIYWKAHYIREGYYVQKDLKEAIRLFKIAADAGLPEAQLKYAVVLTEDPPFDEDIFLDYMTKSAENGNGTALYNLGIAYYKGKKSYKIPKNQKKGIEYLKIAALRDHEKAITFLQDNNITF